MKNVNAIFSEFSIINIKFLYKLAKKYSKITITVPIFVVAFTAFFYLRQHDIYMAKIAFRSIGGHNDSPTNAISDLLGEKTEKVDPGEFLGVAKSVDFLERVANKLASDPNFDNMTFSSVLSTKVERTKEAFAECLDQQCIASKLRAILPSFFTVEMDDTIITRFIVTVKSLDSYTSNKVILAIKDALTEYRVDIIRHTLTDQKEVTAKLIKDRRDNLDNLGIVSKNEQIVQLRALLNGVERKLEIYQNTLDTKRIELSQSEISLKLTKNTLRKEVDPKIRQKWDSYQTLKARRDILMTDITALEQVVSRSESRESQIVTELRDQLKNVNSKISKLEKTRDFVNFEGFRDEKGKSKNYVEFQTKVLDDQIKEIQEKADELTDERTSLITKIKSIEQEIEEHRPSLEYLKLLEQKMLQIQLIEGTVVTDVAFDNFLLSSQKFKKHSLNKTIPFAIVVSLFLVIIGLLLRYLFDERIIDREDFQNNFRDIEVLGDVPEL